MEKYIIIFAIIFIGYVIWKCLNETTENFGDVPAPLTRDEIKKMIYETYRIDVNSINNLSDTATKLQTGGLTNPGNLNVLGDLHQKNTNIVKGSDPNRFIFHTPDDNRKGMWIVPAKDDGASDWLWGNGLNIKRDGESYLGVNVTIPGKLNVNGEVNFLPRGVIVAWNSTTAPAGWGVCDGQNGTPDLRGRFIRSSYPNGNYELPMKVAEAPEVNGRSRSNFKTAILKHDFGDFGGSDFVEMNSNELPAHNHQTAVNIPWGNGILGSGSTAFSGGGGASFGTNGTPFVTNTVGNNWGHNTQPPYYVLTYIMKL